MSIGTHVGFKDKRRADDVGKITGMTTTETGNHLKYTVELVPRSPPTDTYYEACFGRTSDTLEVAEEEVYVAKKPAYRIGQRVSVAYSLQSKLQIGYIKARRTLVLLPKAIENTESAETDATSTEKPEYEYKVQNIRSPSWFDRQLYMEQVWLSESDISDDVPITVTLQLPEPVPLDTSKKGDVLALFDAEQPRSTSRAGASKTAKRASEEDTKNRRDAQENAVKYTISIDSGSKNSWDSPSRECTLPEQVSKNPTVLDIKEAISFEYYHKYKARDEDERQLRNPYEHPIWLKLFVAVDHQHEQDLVDEKTFADGFAEALEALQNNKDTWQEVPGGYEKNHLVKDQAAISCFDIHHDALTGQEERDFHMRLEYNERFKEGDFVVRKVERNGSTKGGDVRNEYEYGWVEKLFTLVSSKKGTNNIGQSRVEIRLSNGKELQLEYNASGALRTCSANKNCMATLSQFERVDFTMNAPIQMIEDKLQEWKASYEKALNPVSETETAFDATVASKKAPAKSTTSVGQSHQQVDQAQQKKSSEIADPEKIWDLHLKQCARKPEEVEKFKSMVVLRALQDGALSTGDPKHEEPASSVVNQKRLFEIMSELALDIGKQHHPLVKEDSQEEKRNRVLALIEKSKCDLREVHVVFTSKRKSSSSDGAQPETFKIPLVRQSDPNFLSEACSILDLKVLLLGETLERLSTRKSAGKIECPSQQSSLSFHSKDDPIWENFWQTCSRTWEHVAGSVKHTFWQNVFATKVEVQQEKTSHIKSGDSLSDRMRLHELARDEGDATKVTLFLDYTEIYPRDEMFVKRKVTDKHQACGPRSFAPKEEPFHKRALEKVSKLARAFDVRLRTLVGSCRPEKYEYGWVSVQGYDLKQKYKDVHVMSPSYGQKIEVPFPLPVDAQSSLKLTFEMLEYDAPDVQRRQSYTVVTLADSTRRSPAASELLWKEFSDQTQKSMGYKSGRPRDARVLSLQDTLEEFTPVLEQKRTYNLQRMSVIEDRKQRVKKDRSKLCDNVKARWKKIGLTYQEDDIHFCKAPQSDPSLHEIYAKFWQLDRQAEALQGSSLSLRRFVILQALQDNLIDYETGSLKAGKSISTAFENIQKKALRHLDDRLERIEAEDASEGGKLFDMGYRLRYKHKDRDYSQEKDCGDVESWINSEHEYKEQRIRKAKENLIADEERMKAIEENLIKIEKSPPEEERIALEKERSSLEDERSYLADLIEVRKSDLKKAEGEEEEEEEEQAKEEEKKPRKSIIGKIFSRKGRSS